MMVETTNVPKLRFKEFKDAWQTPTFGTVFERVTTKNKENNQNILTISAQDGLIGQDKFFTKLVSAKDVTGYYLLRKNDFAYNKSYSKGYPMGAIKRLFKDNAGVVSTLYICFRSKEPRSIIFYEQYFDAGKLNIEIEKIAQEGARNHGLLNMSVVDFFKMSILRPNITEQEKIAGFLGSVDEKIGKLEEKKKQFEKYKKGVMQAIFSQKIRFKDKTGMEFPDWEEKELGEIGKTYNGLTGKSAEDFGKGFPYITYKQIFDGSNVDVSKCSFVNIKENEAQSKAKKGDVFFTTSSETPLEVGFSSVLLEDVEDVYLNSFCFGFRLFDNKKTLPYFLKFLFRSEYFRRKTIRLAQGSTRYNISKIGLLKTIIQIPDSEEQGKIAEFLTSLDDKIDLINKELGKVKEFKKALLQQMFV
ncbi:MAG: restriction endonuclease subunit S [bacterium]|nr:restriction endonuclease subunit S [bacterium]